MAAYNHEATFTKNVLLVIPEVSLTLMVKEVYVIDTVVLALDEDEEVDEADDVLLMDLSIISFAL